MRGNKKRRAWSIAAGVGILVAGILIAWGAAGPGVSSVADSLSGIQGALFSLTHADSSGKNTTDLSRRISDLEAQVEQLQFENSSLEYLRKENEELSRQLSYEPTSGYNKVTGAVIARDVVIPNTLVINRGSEHGVSIHDAVIVGEGHIIGKIIEADPFSSTVLLMTDNQLRIGATKETRETSLGVTQGEFGLSIVLDLVPQNEPLEEGDVIVTSGLEDGTPPGLLIGKVNRIVSEENELFKRATVVPFVDLSDIKIVTVITSQL